MAGCRVYLDGSQGDAPAAARGHPAEGAQMSKKKVFVAAMLGMLVGAGSAHAAGDPEAGKEGFKKIPPRPPTQPCQNKIFPNPPRAMGRPPASTPPFHPPPPAKHPQ